MAAAPREHQLRRKERGVSLQLHGSISSMRLPHRKRLAVIGDRLAHDARPGELIPFPVGFLQGFSSRGLDCGTYYPVGIQPMVVE